MVSYDIRFAQFFVFGADYHSGSDDMFLRNTLYHMCERGHGDCSTCSFYLAGLSGLVQLGNISTKLVENLRFQLEILMLAFCGGVNPPAKTSIQ